MTTETRTRAAEAVRKRERYAARRAQGICVICGHRPAAVPSVKCTECYTLVNQRRTRIRDQRRAAGQCPYCGQPALPDSDSCQPCRDEATSRTRHRRQKR